MAASNSISRTVKRNGKIENSFLQETSRLDLETSGGQRRGKTMGNLINDESPSSAIPISQESLDSSQRTGMYWPSSGPLLARLAQLALENSPYSLSGVRCECDDSVFALNGRLTRFYLLQMAIRIIRPFAMGRRIVVNVEINHPGTAVI